MIIKLMGRSLERIDPNVLDYLLLQLSFLADAYPDNQR